MSEDAIKKGSFLSRIPGLKTYNEAFEFSRDLIKEDKEKMLGYYFFMKISSSVVVEALYTLTNKLFIKYLLSDDFEKLIKDSLFKTFTQFFSLFVLQEVVFYGLYYVKEYLGKVFENNLNKAIYNKYTQYIDSKDPKYKGLNLYLITNDYPNKIHQHKKNKSADDPTPNIRKEIAHAGHHISSEINDMINRPITFGGTAFNFIEIISKVNLNTILNFDFKRLLSFKANFNFIMIAGYIALTVISFYGIKYLDKLVSKSAKNKKKNTSNFHDLLVLMNQEATLYNGAVTAKLQRDIRKYLDKVHDNSNDSKKEFGGLALDILKFAIEKNHYPFLAGMFYLNTISPNALVTINKFMTTDVKWLYQNLANSSSTSDMMKNIKLLKKIESVINEAITKREEIRKKIILPEDNNVIIDIPANTTIKLPNGNVLYKTQNIIVNKGDKVIIEGRNGAGKSTMFKLLEGILGDIESVLLKAPIKFAHNKKIVHISNRMKDYSRNESLIEKILSYIKYIDPEQYIKYATDEENTKQIAKYLTNIDQIKLNDLAKEKFESKVKDLLNYFEFPSLEQKLSEKTVSSLSDGEAAGISLIATILSKPDIIFNDEGMANFSSTNRNKARDIFNKGFEFSDSTRIDFKDTTLLVVEHIDSLEHSPALKQGIINKYYNKVLKISDGSASIENVNPIFNIKNTLSNMVNKIGFRSRVNSNASLKAVKYV